MIGTSMMTIPNQAGFCRAFEISHQRMTKTTTLITGMKHSKIHQIGLLAIRHIK